MDRDHSAIGHKANDEGKQFEALFDLMCKMSGVHSVNWPRGAERRGGRLIPVKTPCDRVLTMPGGKVVFVDCKTFGAPHANMTRSMMLEHQVLQLKHWHDDGCVAGYVVHFREVNKVVFFTADKLWSCWQNQGPCKPYEGLQLGPYERCDPSLIFKKYLP